MTRKAVLQALASVIDPDTGRDIARSGHVRNIEIDSNQVRFTLQVRRADSEFARQAPELCRTAVRGALGDATVVDVNVVFAKQAKRPVQLGARHMIAVASGKGGVGKSTVAANLAVALAQEGFRTGLVDTDIYGPSIPMMFGIEGQKPRVNTQRKIVPLVAHGVHVLSMGLLVDDEQAVIWRGPMVSSAVKQFLGEAEWGDLDFLILDLPPGTGDIQLTIVQTVTLAGAVIVSTPQKVALADARKGVAMFRQVNVPVLGIIENMAWFAPPDRPKDRYYLFGQGGARQLARETGVPLLSEIPLEQLVRESGDDGTPVALAARGSHSARAFRAAASRMVEVLPSPTTAPKITYA